MSSSRQISDTSLNAKFIVTEGSLKMYDAFSIVGGVSTSVSVEPAQD
jgi:hypothetical protein